MNELSRIQSYTFAVDYEKVTKWALCLLLQMFDFGLSNRLFSGRVSEIILSTQMATHFSTAMETLAPSPLDTTTLP